MFKTTKAKILFVSIFAIVCLIVTAILILYQNIEIEEKNEETVGKTLKETKEKDVPGIDINGTYNQNDLKIEEKSVTKEKVEIRYLQISGLKNKTIENKINKEIEILALNCYKDKIKDLNEVINVSINMWELSNFANTISFELSYMAKIDDDDDGVYLGIKGINYDLNTGEEITIDEIFTSDVPIEDVLRQSAYNSLMSCTIDTNLIGELIVSDYGDIEDDIAELIYSYKKGKITNFCYSPIDITIIYDNIHSINIDMEDFAEYIAIYNRYLSEDSLFESEDIGMKNVYTLTNRRKDALYYTNYQNEDNYFIEISIDFQCTEDDEFAKMIAQNKIIEIEKEIEKVKQKVRENPNNFYILNYYIDIYTGEEMTTKQTFTKCYEIGNSYEMTVHDFEENVEDIIIEYNRQMNDGGYPEYIYDFSNVLKIEFQGSEEYYNPETGEKIVI